MLEVRDLVFSYRRSEESLFHGLTHGFTIGRVTAVTGASGCGKSTLLYVLGLLLRPTAGDVWIGGIAAGRLPDHDRSAIRSSGIGFVFQDAALDASRPVLDSVIEPALYAGARRRDVEDRARDLLETFEVGIRADHRPGQVSGGQAQRVAVARALMNNPAIILADEPTGNLDQRNAQAVLAALRHATLGGRIVVIATHDPYVVAQADEVVEL